MNVEERTRSNKKDKEKTFLVQGVRDQFSGRARGWRCYLRLRRV